MSQHPENPIDQVMEDLAKILGKFGSKKKGSNGSGGTGGSNNSSNWKVWAGLIVILVIVMGANGSFYTVDYSEEAVVTLFNAYHNTTQAGLHFKIPFGIDKIIKIPSKRILQEEFGFRTRTSSTGGFGGRKEYRKESLMLTGDLNVAEVEWIVQYRIADPWKFLYHARDVRANIRDASISMMRRVVGDRLVSDVLTTGRVEIASDAKMLIQEVIDRVDMGIHIEKVNLQDVNPPKSVKPAFNDVNSAKQEQEQTINNAERQYNKVIPEAEGKAEQMIADAKAYSINVVNRALGEAERFRVVALSYRQDPTITKTRLYLETMQEVLNNLSTFTVIDEKVKGVLPVFSGMDSLKNISAK